MYCSFKLKKLALSTEKQSDGIKMFFEYAGISTLIMLEFKRSLCLKIIPDASKNKTTQNYKQIFIPKLFFSSCLVALSSVYLFDVMKIQFNIILNPQIDKTKGRGIFFE